MQEMPAQSFPVSYWLLFAACCICCVWQTVVLILYTRQLCNYKKENKAEDSKIVQFLSTTSILFFSLTFYLLFMNRIMATFKTGIHVDYVIMLNVSLYGLGIAIALMRIFYLYRIKCIFKNSIYQISNKLFKFLLIIFVITSFSAPFAFTFMFHSAVLAASAGLFFESIIDLYLCYMFNKNLLSLIVFQRQTIAYHNNNNNNNSTKMKPKSSFDSNNFNERQSNLIETTTKQTVLILIASFMSFILSILAFFFVWYSYVAMIFCVVMSMTIWLSWIFADKDYYRICKLCNKCILKICYCYANIKVNYHIKKTSNASIAAEIISTKK